MAGFSGILVTGQVEDQKMMKGKLKDDKLESRFRNKLVQMIRNAGSKFDDYSISAKIRQILLDCGSELTEEDVFNELTN